MSMVNFYEELIGDREIMYDICVRLLEFDNFDSVKKDKLLSLRSEIVASANYNRVKTAKRIIDKSKEKSNLTSIEEMLANILRVNRYSGSLSKYYKYVRELRSMGPKKYAIECLNQIVYYKKCLKEEIAREKQKEERIKKVTAKVPIPEPGKEIHKSKSVEKITSLDEIIKLHIEEKNIFLEKHEVTQIKKQFEIDKLLGRQGYLSDDTIERLFKLRIANELFDRHEEISDTAIISSMDDIYGLALNEMLYQREYSQFGVSNAIKYENVLNKIQDTRRDFVEEYTKLYEKTQRYLSKASKAEQAEFNKRVEYSRHIGNNKRLLTPEEFRQKVNEMGKSRLDDWSVLTSLNITKAVSEISRYTKYMTAEELASYYHTIKINRKELNEQNLQEIFAYLIESKMKDLEPNLSKESINEFMRKRLVSATKEYLHEEPIFTDSRDVVTGKDYAKDRVESKQAIEKQEKKYFRQSKLRQAIQLMNFKKLKKLSSKEVLTKEEIQKVKEMF